MTRRSLLPWAFIAALALGLRLYGLRFGLPMDALRYLVREMGTSKKAPKDVVLEMGFVEKGDLTADQLDAALDVASMTHP